MRYSRDLDSKQIITILICSGVILLTLVTVVILSIKSEPLAVSAIYRRHSQSIFGQVILQALLQISSCLVLQSAPLPRRNQRYTWF